MSDLATRPPGRDLELGADLRRTVDATDLVKLLRQRAGLTQGMISSATGAAERSVRNWEQGQVKIRRQTDDRLRDLAEVVAVLSATLTPRGIGQWLNARNRELDGERPIDLVAQRPQAIFDVAARFVEGDVE